MTTIQYRLGLPGKAPDEVDGPDDADLVVAVPKADVLAAGFDPTVAFMQGRLKPTGHTGLLLDALASGRLADDLARLVAS